MEHRFAALRRSAGRDRRRAGGRSHRAGRRAPRAQMGRTAQFRRRQVAGRRARRGAAGLLLAGWARRLRDTNIAGGGWSALPPHSSAAAKCPRTCRALAYEPITFHRRGYTSAGGYGSWKSASDSADLVANREGAMRHAKPIVMSAALVSVALALGGAGGAATPPTRSRSSSARPSRRAGSSPPTTPIRHRAIPARQRRRRRYRFWCRGTSS